MLGVALESSSHHGNFIVASIVTVMVTVNCMGQIKG